MKLRTYLVDHCLATLSGCLQSSFWPVDKTRRQQLQLSMLWCHTGTVCCLTKTPLSRTQRQRPSTWGNCSSTATSSRNVSASEYSLSALKDFFLRQLGCERSLIAFDSTTAVSNRSCSWDSKTFAQYLILVAWRFRKSKLSVIPKNEGGNFS